MSTTDHYVRRFDQIPVGAVFTRRALGGRGIHIKNTASTSRPYHGPEPDNVYRLG